MSITVVGMGCERGDITQKALETLRNADTVILRTEQTQSALSLKDNDICYISLDHLYNSSEDFDSLNQSITDTLIEYSKKGKVAYCVEGSGLDDESVKLIAQKTEINIVAGISRETAALSNAIHTPLSVTGVSAIDFVSNRAIFAPDGAFVIKELDNVYIASDVKLKVLELFGEAEVFFINQNKAAKILAEDIDRQNDYDYSTMLLICETKYSKKQRFSFSDLMAIVYRLRDKDGCKWDREQTHESIRINCIEEAYELVEAIDLNDLEKMLEETGDVLLQGVFHAIIAEDLGEYSITDVLTVLSRKLLDRHTHIFGDVVANTPEEALAAWESAKAKEKKQTSYTERMKQVAFNLPALIKADKVQKIGKKANFDWDSAEGALEKLQEEINELKTASPETREEEGGDLLFAAVNVLRHYGVEPELALLASVKKFIERFEGVENAVTDKGKKMTECSLDELDAIYTEFKNANR